MKPPTRAGGLAAELLVAALLLGASPGALDAQGAPFRHGNHEEIDCSGCHGTGTATVGTNRTWCQSCHHTGRREAACTACHDPGALREKPLEVERSIELSVAPSEERRLPFSHATHRAAACSECHTDPPSLEARQLSCRRCHEDHHRVEATCTACHSEEPPAESHPVEAHLSCSGSGCHDPSPFAEAPRTRSACLVCHQPLRDHHPGEECADCHQLPPPRADPALSRAGELESSGYLHSASRSDGGR